MTPDTKPDVNGKIYIKNTHHSSGSKHSHPALIDAKDGKIISSRQFRYNWQHKPEEFNAWKIDAKGYEPQESKVKTETDIYLDIIRMKKV